MEINPPQSKLEQALLSAGEYSNPIPAEAPRLDDG